MPVKPCGWSRRQGQFLGWAAFSPASKIRARVWSFDEAQRIDAAFFAAACASAVKARARFDIQSNAMRLVHGESDGLPGLIVDRYGDTLVAQFTSSGVERWKDVHGRCAAGRHRSCQTL